MAEWLYEFGIGEERAILVEEGRICAARIDWGEALRAGLVIEGQLVARKGKRGTVRLSDGTEVLVDQLPGETTQGSRLIVRITRAPIAERGRTKLAQARPALDSEPRPAPSLLEALRDAGETVRELRITDHDFSDAGWHELLEQALSQTVDFPGGLLTISPTPAMTLIDVDGALPGPALALAAIPAIADALRRFDISGSVGIDFPTLADKRDRQAADAALADALGDWRGERTAMNGFGFVQLVSRLERPSFIQRMARPAPAAVRMLLRQAERVTEPGALLLTAHPAVHAAMKREWEEELARRTGREIRWHDDAGLALTGGFAQAIAP